LSYCEFRPGRPLLMVKIMYRRIHFFRRDWQKKQRMKSVIYLGFVTNFSSKFTKYVPNLIMTPLVPSHVLHR
jgi:hypothetical protein